MKFSFEQNTEDIIDLTKNSFSQNRSFKFLGIFLIVIFLINIISSILTNGFKSSVVLSWVIPILILIILWSVVFKFLLKRRFSKPGSNGIVLGPRTVELLEDEILLENEMSSSSVKWAAVTKFRESDKSYFLYLGSTQAILIPKRILNPTDKTSLEEFVKERIVNEK